MPARRAARGLFAAASSALATLIPARSGRESRTASTRVGDPVCPKRLSYSKTCRRDRSPARPRSGRLRCRSSPARAGGRRRRRPARSASYTSSPKSVCRVSRSVSPERSTAATFVTCGQPRNAATWDGTCQVSESSALRPHRTRSAPSFSIASASVREVPSVSATANTRSERWIARSAPSASASRSASSACGGPMVIATTSSASRAPCCTAYRSKAFSSSGTPSRLSDFVSSSNSIDPSAGTCLTRQIAFTSASLSPRARVFSTTSTGTCRRSSGCSRRRTALEVDRWLLGGDYGTPSPWPDETLARLKELPNATWIRGNGERWLREPPLDRPEVMETYDVFRGLAIDEELVEWLYALPTQAELDGILYVHGSPLSDVESFPPRALRRRRAHARRRARPDRRLRPQPPAVPPAGAERDRPRQSGQRRDAARRRRARGLGDLGRRLRVPPDRVRRRARGGGLPVAGRRLRRVRG